MTPKGNLNFGEILRDKCNFCHSHEHFEIQIADIVGTIIHRFQNRERCKDAYDKLVERFTKKKHDITHLILNPNPSENTDIRFE